jgi:hypothetical protein
MTDDAELEPLLQDMRAHEDEMKIRVEFHQKALKRLEDESRERAKERWDRIEDVLYKKGMLPEEKRGKVMISFDSEDKCLYWFEGSPLDSLHSMIGRLLK